MGDISMNSVSKFLMGLREFVAPVLAVITMTVFLGYIIAVTFIPIQTDLGLVNIAFGWLGGTASTIVSYYFGSSTGSKEKGELIRKIKSGDSPE